MRRRNRPIPEEFMPFVEFYETLDALADRVGWPKEWVVCPHCSQFSWRLPPHMFEACPFVKDVAQSTGLKLDAERSTAIRAGVTMEKQFEEIQAWLRREMGDSEEADE